MSRPEIIDISIPLSPKLPTWPGGYGLSISSLAEIGSDSPANVSRLDMDVHCGTHIDAPLHFVSGGKPTSDIGLHRMIGPCCVAELPKELTTITAADLEKLGIPPDTGRLLLKTSNSYNNLWDRHEFDKDYCAISNDAAEWLVTRGVDLIGIDYCSIQKFFDEVTTHQTLLSNGVIILEGLDLRHVQAGSYELICLPVSVAGVEGVPVRAILQKNNC